MQVVHGVAELRARLGTERRAGARIGLVPTMGNLHDGHLSLVAEARARCDRVVVSVFVNPLQFGPGEDYDGYPRTLERDRVVLAQAGADLLFAPGLREVFPRPLAELTRVYVPGLSEILCGRSRPIHFSGVATVVVKLLNLVQPHTAVFGEKDFQQLLVVRRLVEDLNLPVAVVGAPTVRERDGLAMSSRNAYLSPSERERAPRLYAALRRVAARLEGGESDRRAVAAAEVAGLVEAGFEPDYLEVRRESDLALPEESDAELRVLAAARLGKARLIDNCRVRRGRREQE